MKKSTRASKLHHIYKLKIADFSYIYVNNVIMEVPVMCR